VPDEKDIEQDRALIESILEPVISSIQELVQLVSEDHEKLELLGHLVQDELIGGITSVYEKHQRDKGIAGLSEKYGEAFGPFKDFFSELSGGKDVYEALFEDLEELKGSSEGWDDDKEKARVDEVVGGLKSKRDSLSKFGQPAVSEIEVEIKKEPEAPTVDPLDRVRKMRAAAEGKGGGY